MYLGTKPDHNVFAKWAKKRDIFLNPDVAFLVPTKSMGLGVYALRPLKKGSTIISCPLSSAISPYETASIESPCVAALAQASAPSRSGSSSASNGDAKGPRVLTTTLHICLRLMAELSRPQSPMRPWLECCPKMGVHLFSLTDAQRERLFVSGGGTVEREGEAPATYPRHGWSNVGQQLDDIDVDAQWAAARRVMESRPDVWPAASCTRQLFVECLTQVLSRNFHREEIRGQEGPYLLPGVDFINHSFSHANAAFTMRGGGRAHALCFDVMAVRDIAKGEQIYYQYGPISEARFFVEFQFLNAEPNPYDGLRFSTATLVSMAEATIASLTMDDGGSSGVAAQPGAGRYHLAPRVEELRRMSIFGDEGLWVPQVQQVEGHAAAATALDDGRLPLVKGVAGELWNAVYLLTCIDDKAFDNLSLKLSRHWECPKGALVIRSMSRFLQLRLAAVQQSLAAASEMVDGLCEGGCPKTAASTKALLVKALEMEVAILKRMMDRINGKEEPEEE